MFTSVNKQRWFTENVAQTERAGLVLDEPQVDAGFVELVTTVQHAQLLKVETHGCNKVRHMMR